MTDEEIAEEIANKRCHEIMCYGHCSFNSPKHHRCGEWHREYNCALEGIKAGRPQWHKVAEGDLPTTVGRRFLVSNRYCSMIGYWNGKTFVSADEDTTEIASPITWCEIPTFDKEMEKQSDSSKGDWVVRNKEPL